MPRCLRRVREHVRLPMIEAGVEILVNEVNRAGRANFTPIAGPCAAIEPRERREQRGMNVQERFGNWRKKKKKKKESAGRMYPARQMRSTLWSSRTESQLTIVDSRSRPSEG